MGVTRDNGAHLLQATKGQPEIVYDRGYPAVFHRDFTRVRRLSPAKPGESVIAMLEDLGETIPPVPRGKPFPFDPYAEVAAPVEVRVGGEQVEVLTKIGWPGKVKKEIINSGGLHENRRNIVA